VARGLDLCVGFGLGPGLGLLLHLLRSLVARLGLHLAAHLGFGLQLDALALGIGLGLGLFARLLQRGLLRLGLRFGGGIGLRRRWRCGRSRRRRRGTGWSRGRLRRAQGAEIEIAAGIIGRGFRSRLRRRLACRRLGCGGGSLARRARRRLADEAILVELRDQRLESVVEGLADLLRDVAEGGPAVDRREHRAVTALEEAGLARRLLDALAGLRIDRGGVHSFVLIILGRRITAPARTLNNENVARGHFGLVEGTELTQSAV